MPVLSDKPKTKRVYCQERPGEKPAAPHLRRQWLGRYIISRYPDWQNTRVDVLDRWFVERYTQATNAPFLAMPYGADKCPMLGKDLGHMYELGFLSRSATGIQGMGGMGFPAWVWTYKLTQTGYDYYKDVALPL